METTASIRDEASAQVSSAAQAVRALDLPPSAQPLRDAALAVAEIVRQLDADDDVVVAAMLRPLLDAGLLERETADKRFGVAPSRLARELQQLGQFGLPADWTADRGLETGQAEALRKMLLAVIGDVRLVVVRLAEQLHQLRSAKQLDGARQRKLAIEAREVYAPLANRLGVWQLKWELEDLAFRYLQPLDYKRIAGALNSRRSERERYIEELKTMLQAALKGAGVAASINGRPKHIYSIWRKMNAKRLAFEQLMDIRAARVLVGTVSECYAALGIVHSLWQFIPGEFDDYIATPKDNLYRSIHTAVIGPGNQPVEVQIRTYGMHADSERGVAAHWRYKEGGRGDQAYDRKINQLRALLAPAEGGGDSPGDFLERVRVDLFQDRIYVLSPKGEIVDVPVGGTPLDFAYQVHTDLGHRTRGAKVNGRMVGLDHRLKSGETVEIIAARTAQPSRDWLAPQSGYLASPRHRNKVRAWFRKQDATGNKAEGRAMLERELQRLGEDSPPLPELLAELRMPDAEALHEAMGLGEISAAQVAGAVQRLLHGRTGRSEAPARPRPAGPAPAVEVQGIGDLLSSYARCCKPVPPEEIAGYITVGRGVSIHSRRCANLARLSAKSPARVLAVNWGGVVGGEFPVEIEVQAFDRRGLVRDVSAALADERISIHGMQTVTDPRDHLAHMQIGISITGLPQLSKVLARISRLPNILSVRRRR